MIEGVKMKCFPDHEAVCAVLRVSPNDEAGVGQSLSGPMGDFSSRRPAHMVEDAVRAIKCFLQMD